MRIPRIYTSLTLNEGATIELEESPSHHLVKVLRMSVGRELVLFNGLGGEYRAEIAATSKKTATVSISKFSDVDTESPLQSHLAIGLSRGERFDLAIQKASELGVTEITPLFTERTEVKLQGERLEKKMAAWQKIIVSACEQSGRTAIPKLNTACSITEFFELAINAQEENHTKFVLHHRNACKLSTLEKQENVVFMVGPEGGLSDIEIETAHQHGYQNLNLGPRVLRTETAPLAALSLFQMHWGDI